jgi:iron complex transport system ATP-binding protein
MLEARDLAIAIGGRTLLQRLDLQIKPGECWALLGANGTGKTSLLLALAGLRRPAAGSVTFGGVPLAQVPRRDLARRIGVLSQDDMSEFWGSTLDFVMLGRYPHSGGALTRAPHGTQTGAQPGALNGGDAALARNWLERFDLGERADQPYRTLSGGERQRARVAQLLVQEPQCLLLDEPASHLDLRHQGQVLAELAGLAAAGRAVMMSLHDPFHAARHCQHAVLLYDSGLARLGRCEDILTRSNLEALYRCPIEGIGDRRFLSP